MSVPRRDPLLLDGRARILAAGRAFVAAFAGADPRGRHLDQFLDRGSIEKAQAALERLRAGPQAVELDLVTDERAIRLAHFSFCRAPGPAGEPLIIAAGRDQEPALVFVEQCVRLNRELEQAREELERLAETDPLTGLGNRRWLFKRLDALWDSAAARGRLAWVMMADLDHFKRVNDTLGHQAGDEALRVAAGVLLGAVRPVDVVARYGGEEFVLAGEAEGEEAVCGLACRLLEAIRACRVEGFGRPFGLTMSLGVAAVEPGRRTPPWVALQAADRAAYRAKAAGRDRAEFEPMGGGAMVPEVAAGAVWGGV